MKYLVTLMVALLLAGHANSASASVTIDFEDFVDRGIVPMANAPGASVPAPAQLSNQYLNDKGVVFSSSVPYVAVVGGATFGLAGVGGTSVDGLLSYADPVTIAFFVPGTNTPGVTDSISIQGDPNGISSNSATLTAYDINGIQIGTQTLNDTGSEIWSFSNLPGIHSVQFYFPTSAPFGNGTGIALDNLSFGDISEASAVPEPSSLVVWSVLGIAGVVAYRRYKAI